MMDVSIIIVNYNTLKLTSDCINSIVLWTEGIEYEIVVVDNASTDGSKEFFSKDSRIKYIYNNENLGFGRANNIGIQYTIGRYLFFLNSDTVLLNNAVKCFFDFYESHSTEKIGALGAILMDCNKKNTHSYGQFISPTREVGNLICKYIRFIKTSTYLHPLSISDPLKVDYITGADLFVSREVCETVGIFDPAFFMYCEEVDWQFRMAKAGYERYIINGPEIVHLEGGSDSLSNRQWSFNRINNVLRSKQIYIKKYYHPFILWLYRLCTFILWMPILIVRKDKPKQWYRLFENLISKS